MPLGAAPEAQNGRRVPLEPAQVPQHARKVVFEVTTMRCLRFLRSQWPFEECCPLFVFYRHQLLLGSTLLRACYARAHTTVVFQFNFTKKLSAQIAMPSETCQVPA